MSLISKYNLMKRDTKLILLVTSDRKLQEGKLITNKI